MTQLIVPPRFASPDQPVSFSLPKQSLQALYDLIAHLEVGEFERKLGQWTDMTKAEIETHGHYLDMLFGYLDSQGIRATKFKRVHADAVRRKIRPIITRRDT